MYNPRMLERFDEPVPEERKLTYDDLLAMPEDDLRHEIIDGAHYVTPSPGRWHQRAVGNLFRLIGNHLEQKPVGEVYLAPFDIVFTMFDVVEPDLVFVSAERLSIITDKNIGGAPDLVIEVLSPTTSRRDLGVKRSLYDRGEVSEYWVADPDGETVQVFRRLGDRLAPTGTLARAADDVLTSGLLPGLELPLARIFG
jgi:Uma2 family endonuclease